jgi:hypothetical protein
MKLVYSQEWLTKLTIDPTNQIKSFEPTRKFLRNKISWEIGATPRYLFLFRVFQ